MSWKKYLLILAIASISILGYLSVIDYRLTFPLDDAWIHQAYARNLATNGEWAFISGERSTGATSNLWVFILAVGYLVNINPNLWSAILGLLLLSGIAALSWNIATDFLPKLANGATLLVILIVFEWHLVWAALSGMETLLFSFLITLMFSRLLTKRSEQNLHPKDWRINTLIIAALILSRPDGLSILGPVMAFILVGNYQGTEKRKTIVFLMLGLFFILFPLLLFNYSISGTVFPNTLYAKQAEYSAYLQIPLITRFISLVKLPLVGVGAVLLPGYLYFSWVYLRKKIWVVPIISLWILSFVFLYATRLPLDFQHGRYIMPVMPIYFILGAIGSILALQKIKTSYWKSIFAKSGALSALMVLLIFWFLGRNAFSNDTQFIQSQMIETARWVENNLDHEDLLAVHDIGALGFITERPLVDLAGLISPEIIPFIHDEEKLANYLNETDVDFLLVFPNWYPNLTKGRTIIFQAEAGFPGGQNDEAMAIYKWP